VVVERIKGEKKNVGFNAMTGEYEDMLKAGIVDPAKVTRSALQNAASIGAMLLTTECLVAEAWRMWRVWRGGGVEDVMAGPSGDGRPFPLGTARACSPFTGFRMRVWSRPPLPPKGLAPAAVRTAARARLTRRASARMAP
jgi:hypothetical protein